MCNWPYGTVHWEERTTFFQVGLSGEVLELGIRYGAYVVLGAFLLTRATS